jgi:hypothetical protein
VLATGLFSTDIGGVHEPIRNAVPERGTQNRSSVSLPSRHHAAEGLGVCFVKDKLYAQLSTELLAGSLSRVAIEFCSASENVATTVFGLDLMVPIILMMTNDQQSRLDRKRCNLNGILNPDQ